MDEKRKPGRPPKQPEPDIEEVTDEKTVYDVEVLRDGVHVGCLPDKAGKGRIVKFVEADDAKALEAAGQAKVIRKRTVPEDYFPDYYPKRRVGMRTGQ